MKELKLDFLVATNRTAIVATFEQAWNRIVLSRQSSRLWVWLNYSAHDFRRDSAPYGASF